MLSKWGAIVRSKRSPASVVDAARRPVEQAQAQPTF
jgi:hypothetical protein